MTKSEETVFDEREKELLRLAVQPLAVDEARIPETVRLAVEARSRSDASHRLRRLLTFVVSAAAVAVCLGVVMLKGGDHSKPGGAKASVAPATLKEALAIANDSAGYSRGRMQAAMHLLYGGVRRLLVAIPNQEAVERATREAVLEALTGPIVVIPYETGFEELVAKVEKQQPLTETELRTLVDAARSSIGALRQLGATHVLHTAETKVLCNYLGKRARGEPSPQGDGTEPRRQQ